MPNTLGHRFFRRGFSKIYFLPDGGVAAAANGTGFPSVSPTGAELDAGWDISRNIQGITGFQLSNTPIAVPDLGTRFNRQIAGEDTTPNSNLDFYDEDLNPDTIAPSPGIAYAQDIRYILAKGTFGFIVLCPYGRVTGRRLEVWNVQTLGVNDVWSLTAEAGRFSVPMAVLDVPNQRGLVP